MDSYGDTKVGKAPFFPEKYLESSKLKKIMRK